MPVVGGSNGGPTNPHQPGSFEHYYQEQVNNQG